jgi:hypothetical protein
MTADPWALLREARVSVFHDHEYARIFGTEIEPAVAAVPKLADLLDRIDAALADANAPTVVEWRTIGGDNAFWEAYPDAETGLDATQYEDGLCRWTACVEREDGGYCNSLAEAKAAAEAAMKRLK